MVKAMFFDLFFTLILPEYNDKSEFDVLNISHKEWQAYAGNKKLYKEGALGKIKTEKEIIERIGESMHYSLTEEQKQEMIYLREKRTKNALININKEIIDTLQMIHNKEIKLCLVSNADVIDCKYWNNSKLSKIFDEAIFSCNVKMIKPDVNIYKYAMRKMKVSPRKSIYVGDGGDDELVGAKEVGMKTVFTEYLIKKPVEISRKIESYADYHIDKFRELLSII